MKELLKLGDKVRLNPKFTYPGLEHGKVYKVLCVKGPFAAFDEQQALLNDGNDLPVSAHVLEKVDDEKDWWQEKFC